MTPYMWIIDGPTAELMQHCSEMGGFGMGGPAEDLHGVPAGVKTK
jgi:hypothetical protein